MMGGAKAYFSNKSRKFHFGKFFIKKIIQFYFFNSIFLSLLFCVCVCSVFFFIHYFFNLKEEKRG